MSEASTTKANANPNANEGIGAGADVEACLKSEDMSIHAHAAFSDSSTSPCLTQYPQHDDPDVIIPDGVARPLVVSAHLLLVTAGISVFRDSRYDLAGVLIAVYITSILHWSAPRFSSYSRRADYLAVFAAIAYGTFVSFTLADWQLTTAWCLGKW